MYSSKAVTLLSRTPLAIALLAATGTLMAQDPAPQDAVDIDRVSVTGTRIAREGFASPSPITAVSAEEIRATGAVNIGELMTKLPQLTPTFTTGNSTRFIGTAGVGGLDLRGMGTARTLVLVNGRRHVGALSGSTTVDVNTIPVEWIERIEVITGGASAVYGADAVAGVVNYIMKKSFDGIEMRGQRGAASEGAFDRKFVSFSAGNTFADGRGNAAIALERSEQGRFARGDRRIGRQFPVSVPNPGFDPTLPPSQSNPQNIVSGPGGSHATSFGGTFNIAPFDFQDPTTWGNRYMFEPDGSFRRKRYDGVVLSNTSCVDCDFIDFNSVADLEPAFERTSVNTIVNFDLSDDHRLFFEGKYTKTESNFFSQSAFDSPVRLRRDNAYISPELGALMDANGLSTLAVNRHHIDGGRRGELVDRKTTRFVIGLEGWLGDGWTYETSFNYGETAIDRLNLNNRINDRFHAGLDAAVDANGRVRCRVDIDPDAINPNTNRPYNDYARSGCVPFSIFGEGAISPDAAAWYNVDSPNASKLKQTVYSASVANSTLFSLPAGDVGFAGGLEYRKEESSEIADPLSALGLTFLNAIPDSRGQYDVREAFVETSIPLLAELPGIEHLALDLAGRYSDYSSIGSTKTWNIGLDWQMIPSLRMRGTVARAVRAPSISELFGPQVQNFATIADPCNTLPTNSNRPDTARDPALRRANCAALGVPADWIDSYTANRPGLSGGNAELDPETADSVSFGLVWQPAFIEGLGVSVDYWRITLHDAIGSVDAQTNATRCVDSPGGIDNPFCTTFVRAPASGNVDGQGREFPGHSITSWVALDENLAKSRRVGVDFEVDYRFNLQGGTTILRAVGTRLLQSREWEFQDFPDDSRSFLKSTSNPRYRANLEASYARGDWNANWRLNYIHDTLRVDPDSYASNPGQSSPIRNGRYVYHNAQVGYTYPDSGINVYIGANNLFDKDPPLNYFGATVGAANYDSIGRFVYLGATYRF